MACTPPTNSRDRLYLQDACSFLDSQQDTPGSPGSQVSPLLFVIPTAESFLTPKPSNIQPDEVVLTPQLATDQFDELVLTPQLATGQPVTFVLTP